MHKTTNHRTPAAIVARLIVLVKPMLPIMVAAIVMGVAGHFCATFITIFGGFAILTAAGLQSPHKESQRNGQRQQTQYAGGHTPGTEDFV